MKVALLICAAALAAPSGRAEEYEAVASKVSKDYVRRKQPDGSLAQESYVFGKGDNLNGARVDPTADNLNFMDVARAMAVPLAKQQYVPASEQAKADLLILIYWGTTQAPEHASDTNAYRAAGTASQLQDTAYNDLKDMTQTPHHPSEVHQAASEVNSANGQMSAALEAISAEDQRREDVDRRTAALLGYDSWWAATIADMSGTGLGYRKKDMLDELEEDRYFVILTAIDYKTLVKSRKSKFMWEARFSIREHDHEFDKELDKMAEAASQYFGKDSKGLHHSDAPQGKVEIGPVKSLGVVPAK